MREPRQEKHLSRFRRLFDTCLFSLYSRIRCRSSPKIKHTKDSMQLKFHCTFPQVCRDVVDTDGGFQTCRLCEFWDLC